jgi:hypothetical protein
MAVQKKMTKRDYFNILLNIEEVKSHPDMVNFIQHELELLEKKNAADKKPTAKQTANASIQEQILACMAADKAYTITDMLKEFPCCADLSNQRISALVRLLKDDGKVERFEEKRKAYFKKI